MSLAKRNDGCLECRTRRVRCDKTEPECFKCCKKGIKCSGQGIECRFSSHMKNGLPPRPSQATAATRAAGGVAKAGQRAPNRYRWVTVTTKQSGSLPEGAKTSSSRSSSASPPKAPPEQPSIGPSRVDLPATETDSSSEVVDNDVEFVPREVQVARPQRAIQTVSPQARLFFNHFSEFIAPKMVVFDFHGNGYRDILLPLACEDELVGQAISVIAAFHLSQRAPQMRMAAEVGQHAILSKLFHDSLQLEPRRLFSLSTWATILVLLVGETITGANNYVHLLEILSNLAQSSDSVQSLSPTTRGFIKEQTRMFELFGFPLSSETKGIQTLSKQPDYYLDFMSSYPSLSQDPQQYANVAVMKEAIKQACDLYRNRAMHLISREESIQSVERLKETVYDLDPSVDGCHALVWTYFVAAAESILPEHRAFFSTRLQSLYSCTEFGTIPIAVQSLQHIWANQDSQRWTEVVTRQRPILIM
ncbi:hypothetical protein MKX07_003068 [Trichoderma sp. CBMAI-0711]|uniref:Zn2Cys6 transcriptional regulator n=1 Tax=Trichoderma parareesei TaxID=858221 RepID=A0A2H2ZP56_TRIPA|nr:hypothetical protein MKX07_003068 [Trichoderma sp. CBMAI-0711]OTA06482.1 Zn2Cys6 transcriptional regulator [Trichoderma parareesei]